MANRIANNVLALDKQLTIIDGTFTISATGTVENVKSLSFASAAKTGTGVYAITLKDSYEKIFGVTITPVLDTGNTVFSTSVTMVPATFQALQKSGKVITFTCYDAAGAAVAPADTTLFLVTIIARRSQVGI